MIQPIYLYGSEVLRRKAAEADLTKKDELNALVQDLRDTLTRADGCGLAAPQIGVSLRVVIVDGDVVADTYDYLKGFKRVIINPEILEESDEKVTYSEGCLSIPNIYCDVLRPFACRMVQHELSHLDGNLFTDNVPPIRRKMIASKLQNIAKGKVHPHYNSKLK